MAVLKYTVVEGQRAVGTFLVVPAVFDFPLGDLLAMLETDIKRGRKYTADDPKTRGVYQDYLNTVGLADWLNHQRETHDVVVWDTNRRDIIDYRAGDLVFAGRFENVYCPICEHNYSAADCSTEKWVVGDDPLAKVAAND